MISLSRIIMTPCEEVEPETPRKRAWLQVLIGSLIVSLLAFSVGSVLYYQNKLNEVPQVAVPSVANVSKDEADTQLRNLGFTLEYKNAFSDTVKKGDVISVDPTAGTMIDKGCEGDSDGFQRPEEAGDSG